MGLFERLVEFPVAERRGPPLNPDETRNLLDAVMAGRSSVMGIPWGTVEADVAALLPEALRHGLAARGDASVLLGQGVIGGEPVEFEFVFSEGSGLASFALVPMRLLPHLISVLTDRLGEPVAASAPRHPETAVSHVLWTADGYDLLTAMTPDGAAEIAIVADRHRRRRVVGRRTSDPDQLAKQARQAD